MLVFVFIVVFLVVVYLFRKQVNRHNESNSFAQRGDIERKHIDVYMIYLEWSIKRNETPVTKEEFETLANAEGSINIADLMDKHDKINPNRNDENVFGTNNDSAKECEVSIQIEMNDRKTGNEEFVKSTIVGYVTNSATLGTLLGGNLFGGIFGDYLNKKHKK